MMLKFKKRLLIKLFIALTLVISTLSLAQVPQLAQSWTGLYNDEQKISLFFQQSNDKLTGYSLLNGKKIGFNGKIVQTGLNYTIKLNEDGQGASFGQFVLNYHDNTRPIEAEWTPLQKNIKPKFFTLKAQQCKYIKSGPAFAKTSTEYLKDRDLQVSLQALQYMRNEIYARHGYAFKSKEWARVFSKYDWYMPCFTHVDKRLNKFEKENIRRIRMVEPYAQNVDWGR